MTKPQHGGQRSEDNEHQLEQKNSPHNHQRPIFFILFLCKMTKAPTAGESIQRANRGHKETNEKQIHVKTTKMRRKNAHEKHVDVC